MAQKINSLTVTGSNPNSKKTVWRNSGCRDLAFRYVRYAGALRLRPFVDGEGVQFSRPAVLQEGSKA